MEKQPGVDVRFSMNIHVTEEESLNFNKAVAALKVRREVEGKDKLFIARVWRQAIVAFAKDPQGFLNFIKFKN